MREKVCLGRFVKHYYSGWSRGYSGDRVKSRASVCVRRGCEHPNPWLDEGDPGEDLPEQSQAVLDARLRALAKRPVS